MRKYIEDGYNVTEYDNGAIEKVLITDIEDTEEEAEG